MYVNIKTFWHGMACVERREVMGWDTWDLRGWLKMTHDPFHASWKAEPDASIVRQGSVQYPEPYRAWWHSTPVLYVLYATWLPCPGTDVAAFAGSLHVPAKIPCLVFVLWSHELLVAVGLGPGAVSLFELGWSKLCCGSPGHIVLLRSWDSTATWP